MTFSNLRRLNEIRIAFPTDEDGLVGRECPNPDCLGYFKVKFGTGLEGANLPCHCPYCGHVSGHDDFWTQEQIAYARSVALDTIQDALRRDTQEWDRELRASTRNSFIKLSMEFKGQHHPIRYYREKKLETKVVCDNCTLEYAIYGVFAYCPDCSTHNSLQILKKNLELAGKELTLAAAAEDRDLASYMTSDALENAVSAFDGFGREVCSLHSYQAVDPAKAGAISFQNLPKARSAVTSNFGYDPAGVLDPDDWTFCVQCFQKRHLLAHTMGVIDRQYIEITHDPTAVVGRRITVDASEVQRLIDVLMTMGAGLITRLSQAGISSP